MPNFKPGQRVFISTEPEGMPFLSPEDWAVAETYSHGVIVNRLDATHFRVLRDTGQMTTVDEQDLYAEPTTEPSPADKALALGFIAIVVLIITGTILAIFPL